MQTHVSIIKLLVYDCECISAGYSMNSIQCAADAQSLLSAVTTLYPFQ